LLCFVPAIVNANKTDYAQLATRPMEFSSAPRAALEPRDTPPLEPAQIECETRGGFHASFGRAEPCTQY
jgi:hypothetical protein